MKGRVGWGWKVAFMTRETGNDLSNRVFPKRHVSRGFPNPKFGLSQILNDQNRGTGGRGNMRHRCAEVAPPSAGGWGQGGGDMIFLGGIGS